MRTRQHWEAKHNNKEPTTMRRSLLIITAITFSARLLPAQQQTQPPIVVQVQMPPESIWTTLVKLAIPTLLGAGLGAGLTLYGVGKTNKHNATENAANRTHALQMWDQQTRWTAKRKHYEALVQGLTAVFALATKIRVAELPENKALLIDQFLTELLRAAPKLEVSKLFIKREILALHDTTCETFRSIAVFASDPAPDRMDAAMKAFENRLDEFITTARQDLGYE